MGLPHSALSAEEIGVADLIAALCAECHR